jgi:hypothetical protein
MQAKNSTISPNLIIRKFKDYSRICCLFIR